MMLSFHMRKSTKCDATTAFIVIILSAISTFVCSFHSRCVNFHITSNSNCRFRSTSIDSKHQTYEDVDWENELQREAASALLPVFFPEQSDTSNKPLTAEIALKRLLRQKYSHRQQNHNANHKADANKQMDVSRGRLAELILGKAVMRLRHFMVVAVAATQENTTLPLPYPLNYTELSQLLDEKHVLESSSFSLEQQLSVCELMVREHAHYIAAEDSSQLKSTIPSLVGGRDYPVLNVAIEHSIPVFLASSLISQYGYDTTKKMCSLMNEPGPITIRKNTIKFKGTDEDLCQWLMEHDGVEASPMRSVLNFQNMNIRGYDLDELTRHKGNGRIMGQVTAPRGCICIHPNTDTKGRKKLSKSIWSMTSYQKGFFEVQDAGSQCIVQALNLAPPAMGDSISILDYCCGNGGKTFAIAAAVFERKIVSEDVNSNGTLAVANIVSHDVIDERLRQIKGSLSRVGFDLDMSSGIAECKRDNLSCTLQTATPTDLKEINADDVLFDVVLVDAPCSSSGVLRRRPSQRWLMSEEDTLQTLPDLQLEIIQHSASYVKDGGTLLYATCSLLEEENEEVVRSFEKSEVFRDGGFIPWSFSVDGDNVSKGDKSRGRQHEITLLPSEWNDGFFFARYKRR